MSINTILFDLDNTLVRCMVYYTFTRKNIYKILAKESGYSISEVESIFDKFETERIKEKDGFSKVAFLDSVNAVRVEIYSRLLVDNQEKANEFYNSDAPINLIQFAAEVYEAPYTIYEDVYSSLNILKNLGVSMYVVTKGSFYMQSRKVAMFDDLFDGLFVLPRKDANTWNGVVESMQLDRSTTLVVGDSVKDDINPAILNNMRAIRIERHSTEWVGDPFTEPLEEVTVIKTFDELITLLK